MPQRLHDEALRLRLCVLDLDDIAAGVADALSNETASLHRMSVIELEARIAEVLCDLRRVRSRLEP